MAAAGTAAADMAVGTAAGMAVATTAADTGAGAVVITPEDIIAVDIPGVGTMLAAAVTTGERPLVWPSEATPEEMGRKVLPSTTSATRDRAR